MTPVEEALIRLQEQLSAHQNTVSTAHTVLAEKLDAVLTQTKMTNGRVTALEAWRAWLKGAWTAIVIGSTVIGVVIGWGVAAYFRV